MHYHPLTELDKEEIFEELGIRAFDELLHGIPTSLKNPEIPLADGIGEMEIQQLMRRLGSNNKSSGDFLSFLGAGSYDHFIPAAVFEMMGRHEFITAYTPYQPEAAQGTLQVAFEYQSLIAELTGMDVSNASHYDGATSMAEAVILALRHTRRTKVLLSEAIHPHYRDVVKTYLMGTEFSAETFPFDEKGYVNAEDLTSKLDQDVAAVVLQTPNYFGNVEDLTGMSDLIHQNGSLMILGATPLSMALFKTPGEWGADIAVGEGQPVGIPQGFGGPYLGFFAATKALMRKIPGRLAGITQDSRGQRAYCLTLQAREQHIRREKAASNICTNQALCALAACVHMTLMGKQGMRELAELNFDRANYLRSEIAKIPGFEVDESTTIFNEFRVKSDKPFNEIEEKLLGQKIFAGVSLEADYADLQNQFLVCATETKLKEHLDAFVEALRSC